MESPIRYMKFEDQDLDALLQLSLNLWKDFETPELKRLLQQTAAAANQKIILAKNVDGQSVGFIIVSIRSDYVEGADRSPTGYLEGIYVEPTYRKQGIARKFMELGEQWLKDHGCTQIGSDTWLNNTDSRHFHQQLGFWEEDELVHFLKDIK